MTQPRFLVRGAGGAAARTADTAARVVAVAAVRTAGTAWWADRAAAVAAVGTTDRRRPATSRGLGVAGTSAAPSRSCPRRVEPLIFPVAHPAPSGPRRRGPRPVVARQRSRRDDRARRAGYERRTRDAVVRSARGLAHGRRRPGPGWRGRDTGRRRDRPRHAGAEGPGTRRRAGVQRSGDHANPADTDATRRAHVGHPTATRRSAARAAALIWRPRRRRERRSPASHTPGIVRRGRADRVPSRRPARGAAQCPRGAVGGVLDAIARRSGPGAGASRSIVVAATRSVVPSGDGSTAHVTSACLRGSRLVVLGDRDPGPHPDDLPHHQGGSRRRSAVRDNAVLNP